MKKIKISPPDFVSTHKPVAAYVLRLDIASDALVARFFRVLSEEEHEDETIEQSLAPFDPTSTALLRQVVTQRNFYAAAAVSADERLEGKVLSEIGRHIFRPTIGAGTVVGSGERHDFAAFVFPFDSSARVSEPYNHFTESESVKGTFVRNGRLRDAQPIFFLYSDVATAPIAEWTLAYADVAPFVLEDRTGGDWAPAESSFSCYSLLPTFVATAPASIAPGGSATIEIAIKRGAATIPYSGEIAIEAIAGYAPMRRITARSGTASVRIWALGLEAGDAVRVKIGTRTISGLADVVIPVA